MAKNTNGVEEVIVQIIKEMSTLTADERYQVLETVTCFYTNAPKIKKVLS